MKATILLTSLALAGCASLKHDAHSSDSRGDHQLAKLTLYGTASPPEQHRRLPMSLRQVIALAGGLRNCEECFQQGGEAFLWERAGIAKVRRNDKILDIQPKDFDSFIVEPGDLIYLSHKF